MPSAAPDCRRALRARNVLSACSPSSQRIVGVLSELATYCRRALRARNVLSACSPSSQSSIASLSELGEHADTDFASCKCTPKPSSCTRNGVVYGMSRGLTASGSQMRQNGEIRSNKPRNNFLGKKKPAQTCQSEAGSFNASTLSVGVANRRSVVI